MRTSFRKIVTGDVPSSFALYVPLLASSDRSQGRDLLDTHHTKDAIENALWTSCERGIRLDEEEDASRLEDARYSRQVVPGRLLSQKASNAGMNLATVQK